MRSSLILEEFASWMICAGMGLIIFNSKWTARNCTIRYLNRKRPLKHCGHPTHHFFWFLHVKSVHVSAPHLRDLLRIHRLGVVLVKLWAVSGSILAFDHQEMHVSECSCRNDGVLHCVAYGDSSPLPGAHSVQGFATLIKGKHIRLWQATPEAERCQLESTC